MSSVTNVFLKCHQSDTAAAADEDDEDDVCVLLLIKMQISHEEVDIIHLKLLCVRAYQSFKVKVTHTDT